MKLCEELTVPNCVIQLCSDRMCVCVCVYAASVLVHNAYATDLIIYGIHSNKNAGASAISALLNRRFCLWPYTHTHTHYYTNNLLMWWSGSAVFC